MGILDLQRVLVRPAGWHSSDQAGTSSWQIYLGCFGSNCWVPGMVRKAGPVLLEFGPHAIPSMWQVTLCCWQKQKTKTNPGWETFSEQLQPRCCQMLTVQGNQGNKQTCFPLMKPSIKQNHTVCTFAFSNRHWAIATQSHTSTTLMTINYINAPINALYKNLSWHIE